MGFFSDLFSKTGEPEKPEERLAQWREELSETLDDVLKQEYAHWVSEDGQIIIKRGSAHVIVDFKVEDDGEGYVVIESPIVLLPKGNLLPFYRRLLDLNNNPMMLGALSTQGNVVTLRRTMPIKGLDDEGFAFAVFSLCDDADDLDDVLIEEFKAPRFKWNENGV